MFLNGEVYFYLLLDYLIELLFGVISFKWSR